MVAGLHQYHRECYGHVESCLLEREILALAVNGFTLDWRRHIAGRQRFQAAEGCKQLPLLRDALAERMAKTIPPNEHHDQKPKTA
jgi:hypothetical protein